MTLYHMTKKREECEIILNVDGQYLFADRYECRNFPTEEGAREYARKLGYK